MNFFNRGKSYGGRDRQTNNRGRDDKKMHRTTCDECGRSCEVPFRPSGDKPVYCSSCFSPREDNNRDRGGRDRGRSNDRGYDRQMHKAVCDDCGKTCEVPFKPTRGKEIFCDNCFKGNQSSDKRNNFAPNNSSQSNEKHGLILAKLDRIIALLEDKKEKDETSEKKPAKKTAAKKTVAKKATTKKVAKKTTVKKK